MMQGLAAQAAAANAAVREAFSGLGATVAAQGGLLTTAFAGMGLAAKGMGADIQAACMEGGVQFALLPAAVAPPLAAVLTTVNQATAQVRVAFASLELHAEGTQAMQGFLAGLNAMRPAVLAAANEIAAAVAATIRGALAIQSPSRVLYEIGAYTGEGFKLGLTDSAPGIAAASEQMALSVPGAVARTPAGTARPSGGSVYNDNHPEFHLTVEAGASGGDRALASKIKGWLDEAMRQVIESEERRMPALREV